MTTEKIELPWEKGWRKGKLGENKEVVLRNLLEFKEVMNKYDVPFSFCMGTLLGAVREGDFIYQDDDIDVVVGYEFKNTPAMESVRNDMCGRGFWVPTEGMPEYDACFIGDGEKIEIWYYERIGDYRVYDCERVKTSYFRAELLERTQVINFQGHEFLIPDEAVQVLDLTYGKDEWRVDKEHAPHKASIVANLGNPFLRLEQRPKR